jgi:hypothetical protein
VELREELMNRETERGGGQGGGVGEVAMRGITRFQCVRVVATNRR